MIKANKTAFVINVNFFDLYLSNEKKEIRFEDIRVISLCLAGMEGARNRRKGRPV